MPNALFTFVFLVCALPSLLLNAAYADMCAASGLERTAITDAQRQQWLSQTDPEALKVLTYWFEQWDQDISKGGRGEYNEKWFPHGPKGVEGSKQVDAEIREKFMGTFEKAAAGTLNWKTETNPYENLAYILLLDQFTRNMFRGTEKSYQYDHLSRAAAVTNINNRFYDAYFTGYQKLFVVYPLMHHENIESQQMSLCLLKFINADKNHPYAFLNAMQKGMEHYQMIFMFSRFPHRNVRLGRDNTELESAYLDMKGTKGFVDGSKW